MFLQRLFDRRSVVLAAILAAFMVHGETTADIIDLNPGVTPSSAGGPGFGRSIYLRCEEGFSISSVGIRGDLVVQDFDVVIYAGNGVSAAPGPVLASTTGNIGGAFGWHDLTIHFFFQAGKEYIVHWRPTVSNNTWVNSLEYFLNWGNSTADDVDLGPVLMMDGREGHTATNNGNTAAPHMRLNRIDTQFALHPPVTPAVQTGPGSGRSMYMTADEDFLGTSIGIRGELGAESYDVIVYEGAGVSAAPGPILATATAVRGGPGQNWYDIPLDFHFRGGNDYIVHWRPSDGSWDLGNLEYFSGWGNDPADDTDLGPATIRDGRDGFDSASFTNTVAPHMRLGVAPCQELSPILATQDTGGPGAGRSIYLTCDNNVRIREIGIFGNLVSQSFDVVVYQGAGVNAAPGAVLASTSAVRGGGANLVWNDIPLDLVMIAGQDYIVHWRPTTSNTTWAPTLRYLPLWGNDPGDDRDLGPLTVRDGREGYDSGSFTNTFAPLMRVKYRPICHADTNGDGVVNVIDLLALLANWGACPPPCPPACVGDANGDCVVNVTDLLTLLAAWGPCP